MPYRLNPQDKLEVQVKKNNRWRRVKKHTSQKNARAHVFQLKKNVKH